MAAPLGNQNAAKAKRWTAAIERALERRAGVSLRTAQQELDELAEQFLTAVATGQKDFFPGYRELGDRLEGKAAKSVAVTGEDGGPVQLGFKVVLG